MLGVEDDLGILLNHLSAFSTQEASQALTQRLTPCAWLAPHAADFLAQLWVPEPPICVFGTLPLVGGRC